MIRVDLIIYALGARLGPRYSVRVEIYKRSVPILSR